MSRQINTEITIEENTSQVWNALLDFENYTKWNPFITSIKGDKKAKGKLKVIINPPNSNPMTFAPTIQVCELEKEFTWLGSLLFKGIFDGRHSFRLIENKNGTTTLKHSEIFNGILTFMVNINSTTQGFEAINQALKKYVEKSNS